MRVLCIRLANLASLAGEHVLDLEGVLGNVGILPITGKTGAGKSTILDAMTIALYRRVARLPAPKSRGVAESDAGLPANDPRTLLREDAGEGFAEVEFMARDGKRYLARWEVRRARGKAGGRLQKEKWTLADVASGKCIGHKLAEVGDAIRARVGLDYREFCQAIVLPQGRFAALLRSPAKERAELLESITGTGIYSRISQLAHEHARDAKRRMAAVETQIESAAALPKEERASLELRYRALSDADKTIRQRLESAREQARHLRRLDELLERVAAATADVETAEARLADFADTGRELTEAIRLQPLRALFVREGKTEQRISVAKTTTSERDADVANAADELVAAAEELKAAQQEQRAFESELARVTPELVAARDLDRDISARTVELTEARATRDEAHTKVEAARAKMSALGHSYQTAIDERTVSELWLSEHAGDAHIAKSWAVVEPELDRLAQLETKLEGVARTIADTNRKLTGARADRDGLQARANESASEVAKLDAALLKALAQLEELGEPTFRSDSEQLTCAFDRARDLMEAANSTAALATELETADALAAKLEGRLLGLRHREQEAQESEALARAALELHRRLFREGRAIAGYAEVRSELTEGEACPLCGAHEHPYVADSPAPVLAHLESEAKAAESAHEYALTEMTSVRSARTGCAESLHEARVHSINLAAGFEAKLALLQSRSEMPDAPLREITAELSDQSERLAAARAALRIRGEGISNARKAQAEWQEALDRRRRDRAKFTEQLSELQASLAADEKTLSLLTEQHQASTEEATGVRTRIEDALPQTEGRLDARRVRVELEGRARQYGTQQAGLDDAARRVADLKHQTELQGTRLTAAETLWAREDVRCSSAESSLASLRARRDAVLEGRSVKAQEALLEERRARVSAGGERAESRRERATLAATTANARQQDASDALKNCLAERETAREDLVNALHVAGVERTAAEGLLASWDEERIEAVKADLERVRSGLAVAQGVHQSRVRELAEHGPAPYEHAEVDERISRCTAAIEAIGSDLELTSHERRVDDTQQATVAGLSSERESVRAEYESAEALSSLIGSADGALLRTFAQGLTLEVMVGRANTHLQDLAPNLRLRRQGDVDLEVIDSDNANATRSVHSLSGGESFLISLSLALALGSLSGEHVHVESMFIDEGFGSLDVDTLDFALAALESLQAQGRQVVLISHVAGLVERFPVYVRVRELSPGRSTVETVGTQTMAKAG